MARLWRGSAIDIEKLGSDWDRHIRAGQVGPRGHCSISRSADMRPLPMPISQRLHVDSGLDFYFGLLAAWL